MRINIRISLESFIPARNFKKVRILKLKRFILFREISFFQNPGKSA